MIPHFKFPYSFGSHNDQDTLEDVQACVAAILSCPRDFRVEKPEFGITDPTFSQGGADLPEIRAAIANWEPRADAQVTQAAIEDATANVRVTFQEPDSQ